MSSRPPSGNSSRSNRPPSGPKRPTSATSQGSRCRRGSPTSSITPEGQKSSSSPSSTPTNNDHDTISTTSTSNLRRRSRTAWTDETDLDSPREQKVASPTPQRNGHSNGAQGEESKASIARDNDETEEANEEEEGAGVDGNPTSPVPPAPSNIYGDPKAPQNDDLQPPQDDDEDEGERVLVFTKFTKQSYKRLLEKEEEERKKAEEKAANPQEAKLVDGELKFDDEDEKDKLEKDPLLVEGNVLPEDLGADFPKELYGKPIEEIDPYLKEKSFVVVSPRFKKQYISRFSATKAFFILTPWNPLRQVAVFVATHQIFDYIVILTILINCVMFGIIDSPQEPEYVFLVIYTIEMLVKMLARGFIINKYTYLRDAWNWLDFVVIVLAYTDIIITIGLNQTDLDGLSVLKTFRVLRAFKTFAIIPGLKTIVSAVFKSVKMLAEVMVLILFCMIVFSLFAIQLYQGKLLNKCVAIVPPQPNSTDSIYANMTYEDYYFNWTVDTNNWFVDDEGEHFLCGNGTGAQRCSPGYFCLPGLGENPNSGFTHFDSFHWAMLNIFQLITLDFWEDTYNKIIKTQGGWNILFFVAIIFFGAFYLINLLLAVVAMSYDEEAKMQLAEKERKEKEEKKKQKRLAKAKTKQKSQAESRILSIANLQGSRHFLAPEGHEAKSPSMNGSVKNISMNGSVKHSRQSLKSEKNGHINKSRISLKSNGSIKRSVLSLKNAANDDKTDANSNYDIKEIAEKALATSKKETAEDKRKKFADGGQENQTFTIESETDTMDTVGTVETQVDDLGNSKSGTISDPDKKEMQHPNQIEEPESNVKPTTPIPQVTVEGDYDNSKKEVNIDDPIKVPLDPTADDPTAVTMQNVNDVMKKHFWVEPEDDPDSDIEECESDNEPTSDWEESDNEHADYNCKCCRRCCVHYPSWLKCQHICYVIVSEPLFEWFITACILLNTLFMAMEHHDMDQDFADILKYFNYLFTGIFTLECVLKLMALTKFYFKSGWNIFDFVIVLLSLAEFGVTDLPGASAVRTLRLFRVFKLAQSWNTMRVLLTIIFQTMGSLTNVTFVLAIVLYIFAVIGMQLFRNKYIQAINDGVLDSQLRWHFIDLHHSVVMVFRILCGEWVEPLWDCMQADQTGACIPVFLLTLMLGNFLVLNLFLALLLNSFGSDTLKNEENSKKKAKKESRLLRKLRMALKFTFNKKKLSSSVSPSKEGSQKQIDPEMGDTKDGLKPSPPEITYHLAQDGVASEQESKETAINGDAKHNENIPLNTILQSNGDVKHESEDEAKDIANDTKQENADTTEGEKDAPSVIQETISHEDKNEAETKSDDKDGVKDDQSEKNTDQVNDKPVPNGVVGNKKNIAAAFTAPRGDFTTFPAIKIDHESNDKGSQLSLKSMSNTSKTDASETKDETPDQSKEAKEKEAEEVKEQTLDDKIIDCCPAKCYSCSKCMIGFDDTTFGQRWRKVRKILYRIVEHKVFEGIILFLIAASSITLCFEDVYLPMDPVLGEFLSISNIVFCILFGIEMIMKWIAYGMKKYFTDFWTILDFAIVCISIFGIISDNIPELSGISAFRALRTLRALRPLRAVSRWQGMKIVVNALANAIPSFMNVLMVGMIFWLIAAIMGVQLLGGRFYKCVDADGETVPWNETTMVNKSQCLENANVTGYSWKNSKIHFNNVGASLLAIFQVATFEGWMEVMIDATDMTDVDLQPKFENCYQIMLYFVGVIVVGSFFTLNLFIGVIIDNFNALKKKYEGSALDMFLTAHQRNYYNTLKKLGNKKPQKTIRRPKNKFQGFFFDVAISNKFEMAIVVLIFINMLTMTIEHYGQSQELTDILEYINIVFTTIFALEAIIKILGLRWHYFRRVWNCFDFIIVALSILGVAMGDLLSDFFITPSLLRVVRVFRIGRVLRLVKAAKGVRKLLFALVISIPALVNIGALLFLLMIIYAIIMMVTFGFVKHADAIDDTTNFETFGNSMLLMFRLTTSAGWNDILDPLILTPPDCNDTHVVLKNGEILARANGDCGDEALAIVFMVTYIILNFLIIINMYIAVILENFNQAHEQEEIGITEDDFDMFYVVWERYDPHASQYIKYEQLSDFVSELDDPLGMPKPNTFALVAFNLPIVEGDKLHCLDILMALVKHVLGDVDETAEFKELRQQMQDKFNEAFPTRIHTTVKTTTMRRKKEDVAARTLQRAWRRHKMDLAMMNLQKMAMAQVALNRSQNAEVLSQNLSTAGVSRGSSKTSLRDENKSDIASPGVQKKSSFGNTLQVPTTDGYSSSEEPVEV